MSTAPEMPSFTWPQPKREPLKHFTYRDNQTFTRCLQAFLVLFGLFALTMLIIDVIFYFNLELASPRLAQLRNDWRQPTILAMGSAEIIFFAYWTYRAIINSTAQCPYALRYTPLFSSVGYVIPGFNFFVPMGAMRQAWNIGQNPEKDPTSSVAPVLILWWASWLYWLVTPLFLLFLIPLADMPRYVNSDKFMLVSEIFLVINAATGFYIIGRICRMQQQLQQKLL